LLARDTKVDKQSVKQLATIAKSSPQAARHVIANVKKPSTPNLSQICERFSTSRHAGTDPGSSVSAPRAREQRQFRNARYRYFVTKFPQNCPEIVTKPHGDALRKGALSPPHHPYTDPFPEIPV
jgi:hypothetical protein